jgi:hypothetical protein
MHDAYTQVLDINIPFTGRKNSAGAWEVYPRTLLTIWHVDTEADGTDDACGWFLRTRHVDQEKLKKIEERYEYEYENLFDEFGNPKFSAQSITLTLFLSAAYIHFGNWKKTHKYMRSHLFDLLYFAENPVDSLYSSITDYEGGKKNERIRYFASCIYPYILRDIRPWWKHPRWHIHHWKIQVPMIQVLKRFLFSRCEWCGKRFRWGESPTVTSWDHKGPFWFRSERNAYHSNECIHNAVSENKKP